MSTTTDADQRLPLPADNPFAGVSTLPFELPPFADIRVEHFAPALSAGIVDNLAEIDAIVNTSEGPTFENTVVALERSGQLLNRTALVFDNLVSSVSSPELREIETDFAPKLAAHRDALYLNRELFARLRAVHAARYDLGLDPESLYLIERYHTDFVLAGAELDETDQVELRDLNQQLSVLSNTFQQNLLAATEDAAVLITERAELDGMRPEAIAATRAAAAERGLQDGYLIALVLPTAQPALAVLTNRAVRRRIHQASVNRASSGEYDNRPVAIAMSRLRAKRAALLGFASHADVVVADQTAGTSQAVKAMLDRLAAPAVRNAEREAEALAPLAARDGIELQPWDWAYYSEKYRAEHFSMDFGALRPYFELDRVLVDGAFFAAGQVYGVTFHAREDLVGYHPDVRVWEVRDESGEPMGLYLGDFYARDGKRGGAWMSSFVDQSALLGSYPVIVNNLNVPKPAAGERAFLTFDEVTTLFHEFGHSLHGLFSKVTYPRFSGTNVPSDFVEFPSQVNEMWALWPEVLSNYARHAETGEPLPTEAVDAIHAAELWGQGFGTVEYLAATEIDQAWHRIGPDEQIESAEEFEQTALARAGLDVELVPPRYRTPYFQHIFGGGYAAGYYSYIWSEVLDADSVEWFKESGGMKRAAGDIFRAELLSVGGSKDPLEAFRAVRGRQADIGPLLRRRGLV